MTDKMLALYGVWAVALLTLVVCSTKSTDRIKALIHPRLDLDPMLHTGVFIHNDGWILVFRATAGLGTPVYDTWTRVGCHDDYKYTRATMPCGCTRTSGSCDRHYRSFLLDAWPSAALDKVKVVLYEEGVEKAHMVFTGQGSNYVNWFSANRLLESSWSDVKATSPPYFSIFGVDEPERVTRRFYVSKGHFGCPSDYGWISIKDKGSVCPWEASDGIPTFFYSKAKTGITWEAKGAPVGRADVMAVWVKFDSSVDLNKPCLA